MELLSRHSGRTSSFHFFKESFATAWARYPALANVRLSSIPCCTGAIILKRGLPSTRQLLVARFGGVAIDPHDGILVTEDQPLGRAKLCEAIVRGNQVKQ